MVNIDCAATKVTVGTATGQTKVFIGTGELNLPRLPDNFPVTGHIMPGFRHTLIGVGPLCDADCTVTFTSAVVVVRDPQATTHVLVNVTVQSASQSGPTPIKVCLITGM